MGILLEPIKQHLGASDFKMGFRIGLTFAIFYATLGVFALGGNLGLLIALLVRFTLAACHVVLGSSLAGFVGSGMVLFFLMDNLAPVHMRSVAAVI